MICHPGRQKFSNILSQLTTYHPNVDATVVEHKCHSSTDLKKIRIPNAVAKLMLRFGTDYYSVLCEVSEYEAHVNALQEFVDSGEEECMVVDDISVTRKDFTSIWLNTRHKLPAMYDVVSLSGKNRDLSLSYLIRKNAAKRFLEWHESQLFPNPRCIEGPIPHIIQEFQAAGINIITTDVPLFIIHPHNYNIAFSNHRQTMIADHQQYCYEDYNVSNAQIEIIPWGYKEGQQVSERVRKV